MAPGSRCGARRRESREGPSRCRDDIYGDRNLYSEPAGPPRRRLAGAPRRHVLGSNFSNVLKRDVLTSAIAPADGSNAGGPRRRRTVLAGEEALSSPGPNKRNHFAPVHSVCCCGYTHRYAGDGLRSPSVTLHTAIRLLVCVGVCYGKDFV